MKSLSTTMHVTDRALLFKVGRTSLSFQCNSRRIIDLTIDFKPERKLFTIDHVFDNCLLIFTVFMKIIYVDSHSSIGNEKPLSKKRRVSLHFAILWTWALGCSTFRISFNLQSRSKGVIKNLFQFSVYILLLRS